MLTAIDPYLQRRLQARTRILVHVYDALEGDGDYGHDYGSYGHETGDILWWYEDGQVQTAGGDFCHYKILGDSDSDDDLEDSIAEEDYIRGRYSPVNNTISLIPALADDCYSMDYDIPREVFAALEVAFPDATEIEIF